MQNHIHSINDAVDEHSSRKTSFAEILPDEKNLDPRQSYSDSEILRKIATVLSEREVEVVTLALGLYREKLKLSDIGRKLGVTRERVRQILNKALDKISVFLQEEM